MNAQGKFDAGSGLYYTEQGPSAGEAVLLAHSIMSDGASWARQSAWLARTHRVIAIDLPGHGQAPVAGEVTLPGLADAVARLADTLGFARFHFMGVSLGAMIGFDLATRHADRLASLVACDAPSSTPDNYAALWDERIARARREGMAALVDETLARWFTPPTLAGEPALVAQVREQILKTPVEGYAHCARAISRFDYRDGLARSPVRATLTAGEADGVIVPAMREQARAMPHAQWVEIPGAGHLPQLENPAAFEAMMAAHFGKA